MRIVVPLSLVVVLLPGQPGNFLPTTGRAKDRAFFTAVIISEKFIKEICRSSEQGLCHCQRLHPPR